MPRDGNHASASSAASVRAGVLPGGLIPWAAAILILASVAATLTCEWDTDVFWHLASGDWMLAHRTVLRTDPFSVDPMPHWVNVHWLFQVIVSALHALGGLGMLSVMKCSLAAATMLVLVLALRRRVHPAWLIFSGLAMLEVMSERVRVRPETFTMCFVMLTVVLLESVRRGDSPRRLWWLLPLMLLWVNMHSLYILGVGTIWAAMLGAWLDRRLGRGASTGGKGLRGNLVTREAWVIVVAATAACLVSPWPIDAAVHPFLLWSRVSGQAIYYTYGVGELQPTYEALAGHVDAIILVAMAGLAMAVNRRALPISHVLWLVTFVFLALLARRNVGLIAPVCGYLLALHGQGAWDRLGRARPGVNRLGTAMTVFMIVTGAVVAAGYATEWIPRLANSPQRLGLGVSRLNYPIAAARFLQKLPAQGDILCEDFGDAATFIYHTPRRKVWMDGRLEVHTTQRFIEQHRIRHDLRRVGLAGTVRLPESVRFIIVHRHSREQLSAMMQTPRFRLTYIDPVAVCFARNDWRGETPAAGDDSLSAPNFEDYDRPLGRDGFVQGRNTEKRRWYRQNPPPENYWIGTMMVSLAQPPPGAGAQGESLMQQRCALLAERYLTAAYGEDLVPRHIAAGTLAEACQQRSVQLSMSVSAEAPADVYSARALRLYREVDLNDLGDVHRQLFALEHVLALVQARQYDAAGEAVTSLLDHLPAPQRVNPAGEYLNLREVIAHKLDIARGKIATGDVEGLPPVRAARVLVSSDFGLIDRAIAALRAAPRDDLPARRMLGDLLLRQGRTGEARKAYQAARPATAGRADAGSLRFRQALCDWIDGRCFDAADSLEELAKDSPAPIVRYYQALLLEQIGQYDAARSAIADVKGDQEELQQSITRLGQRLSDR